MQDWLQATAEGRIMLQQSFKKTRVASLLWDSSGTRLAFLTLPYPSM